MPPPRPKGIDANTHRFFTTGKVSSPPTLHIAATQGKKPPAYSFSEFKGDMKNLGNAVSKENDKSNERTVKVLNSLGSGSKKTAEAVSTPLIIACCVGGVLLLLYITKK